MAIQSRLGLTHQLESPPPNNLKGNSENIVQKLPNEIIRIVSTRFAASIAPNFTDGRLGHNVPQPALDHFPWKVDLESPSTTKGSSIISGKSIIPY
jgi:hypothetical protein